MRRRLVVVLAFAVIAAFAAWLVGWSPLFDSPERHVARYLDATSSGDTSRALSEWSVYEGSARVPLESIAARRRDMTNELAAAHAGSSYSVTAIDYWRTCCEPGRIADARNAGLARVHVTTAGRTGKTYRLLFEVWVKDLTWWGDAKGEWLHDWRLYEIHDEEQACVFPNPVGGCIRSFD